MNPKAILSKPNRIPMLRVYVADPYYATNAVPSYVCAIDINTCMTEYDDIDLLNKSELDFVHRIKMAFARGLDSSLADLVDSDTRACIISTAFFNNGEDHHIAANTIILNAINNVAKAINNKSNLYYNKLSFNVEQVGWSGASPFNLEYRVEWVDSA